MNAATPPPEPARADTSAAFEAIARLARAEAGLVLAPAKATMVQSRLRDRLKDLSMPDLDAYSRFVCSDAGKAERRLMISALTTNVSHFFREAHHFQILKDGALPDLIARARDGGRLRIWSAGCSSGQEPYSIAMEMLDMAPDLADRDVLILGTDIDPRIIETAKAGTYSADKLGAVSKERLRKYFTPGPKPEEMTVTPELRGMVRFRELNLLHNWPMAGRFDVVFCRNVVIYFDPQTQAALWPRFRNVLTDTGWFFLGHSERISDESARYFRAVGQTAYRPETAGPQPVTGV